MTAGNHLLFLFVSVVLLGASKDKAFATDLVGGEQPKLLSPGEALEKFQLYPGFEINLYASEVDFPIQSPAAMTFDSRGRLWVGNIPTQPHAKPGVPIEDSVIVLEDTDHDGVADRHQVFATGLYLPLGLAVADGGRTVYVTDEPNLVRLRDVDGDGDADEKEIVLSGFGTEDNHHFISAFQWGPGGRLYFGQGLFLNTQVETPFGPVRAHQAAVFRYDPRDNRLGVYANFGWSNVWGIIFDPWGQAFLNDASPALNYFLSHTTSNFTYPKPGKYSKDFTKRESVSFTPPGRRPSCGNEFLLSDHFPEEVRGWYVTNQMKGWHGIRWYKIEEKGSGVTASQPFGEGNELLTTSDIMFRPTALQIGPDGALYVLDYYNPIVGHTTYSFRDARQIKTHGRIWRITHKDGEILRQPAIFGESIESLLGLLETDANYRTAYLARQELHERDSSAVLPAVESWIAGASPGDEAGARRLLEALWLYEAFNYYDFALLRRLLGAEDHHLRGAALRVLRYWQEELESADSLELLAEAVRDRSQSVRLEALVNLGYHADPKEALEIGASVLHYEMDAGMENAAHDTFSYLVGKVGGIENAPAAVDQFLLSYATDEELLARAMSEAIAEEILRRPLVEIAIHREAIAKLAEEKGRKGESLVEVMERLERAEENDPTSAALEGLLLSWPAPEIKLSAERVARMMESGNPTDIMIAAQAALIRADALDGNDDRITKVDQVFAAAVARAGRGKTPDQFYERLANGLTGAKAPSVPLAKELMSAIVTFPSRDQESLKLLAGLADQHSASNLVLSFAALEAMKRIPKDSWPADLAIKTLSKVKVSATPDLKFVPAEFTVSAGSAVELAFYNPDNLYHNLVLVKPETVDQVGLKADMMAAQPNGLEKHYVPDDPNVLHWTPQITIGMARTYTLRFFAPMEPGIYPYICTFPGHWRIMRGEMRVVGAD